MNLIPREHTGSKPAAAQPLLIPLCCLALGFLVCLVSMGQTQTEGLANHQSSVWTSLKLIVALCMWKESHLLIPYPQQGLINTQTTYFLQGMPILFLLQRS